jgi:NAD(P)-dependent dehydrogenase (short-subunit alcohol dehydrogenase family)
VSRNTTINVNRRLFLQAALLGAAFPGAWAATPDPARAEITLPRGPFGEASTAEEVTAGLDLSGMTAVVTGCNSGLGFETMRVLALRGAHVIGTARTAEKARKACAAIAGETTPVVLELSDFGSVNACAAAIKGMGRPIDMLICNAGIMALPELDLVYGLERQFVVNHLGHFLLVNQLLDAVAEAEQGRVVMVSSRAHRMAPESGIDFDNLDGSVSYTPWEAYGRSKLANGLFAAELARRTSGTSVTANSLHPGVIRTNLVRHLDRVIDDSRFDKSIPQGAATQCYVAAHPIPAAISGEYFVDCNPARASDLMYDEALAAKLWTVSEELVRRHGGMAPAA